MRSQAPRDFTSGTFKDVLQDTSVASPDAVDRVILCSGKVYYDLEKFRSANNITSAAIIRVEQLYPLNEKALAGAVARLPKCEEIRLVPGGVAEHGRLDFDRAFFE